MSTTATTTEFTIRRKVLTVFGAKFHIYNAAGNLLGFCKQKAFRLKEDIRVYSDETMSDERLVIKARSAIDFSAAYDVVDSREQRKVGALRRKGFTSMFRDEWQVLDENDHEVGTIREDNAWMALFRRYLSNLIPQSFHLKDLHGQELAMFRTHFNPFIHRMTVSVFPDCPLDAMLVLSAGILLVAIEGRQG
jgi:hypothetical protein